VAVRCIRPALRSAYRKALWQFRIVLNQTLRETLNDVTLLADIVSARSKWVGKTLWYRGDRVRNTQDVHDFDGAKVLKFQPVKVLNVIAGSDDDLDFVVELPSGPALIGVRFSASNFGPEMIETFRKIGRKVCTFDKQFFVADPRSTHKWPAEIWSAIERGEARVSMTTEQAIMAWGEPSRVNETETAGGYRAQWVYGDRRYLYVDGNNRVSAIQQ
jgi:hypothetical protein